jgi:hypothetical protein
LEKFSLVHNFFKKDFSKDIKKIIKDYEPEFFEKNCRY